MRFVCESCRAQYMINDDKVGAKGVKVRCRKCGYVILVKKGDAAKAAMPPPPPGPGATMSDPDDAMATQVMSNPLDQAAAIAGASPGATMDEGGNPFADEKTLVGGGPENILGGVDEDEIGAVFDQVLNSGKHSIPKDTGDAKAAAGALGDDDDDDRQSTRVLDAMSVQKLAEESAGSGRVEAKGDAGTDVPLTDWFVAIDEKQTGPLTLEKVKEHWDRGEISPDSLCWRAGFPDWVPLSEVAQLTAVLAPRPAKPIVVAAPSTPMVSVPVESAFSAGGVSKSVRSEVAVPLAASAQEETGTWKPSAASALASLVKDELDALAKPAAPPKPNDGEGAVAVKGLLDLPSTGEHAQINGNGAHAPSEPAPSRHTRPPAPAYVGNAPDAPSYSTPAMSQYRPPSSNRGLMIGLIAGGGGLMFLVLIGLIVWLANRQPVVVTAPAPTPVAAAPAPVPTPAPVAAAPAPVAAAPTPAPVAAAPVAAAPTPAAAGTPPVAAPAPVAAAPKTSRPMVAAAPSAAAPKAAPTRAEPPEPAPAAPAKKAVNDVKGDDFDDLFGGGKRDVPKQGSAIDSAPAAKKSVYVPPAPGGGGDVKDALGTTDVMEVVSSNKAALGKCAEEQRKREPGVTGKLVMKWTVQTSGKTSNVSVQSEEFKGTYMAGCVGGLIKGWNFPKHKQQGEPIVFPFKF